MFGGKLKDKWEAWGCMSSGTLLKENFDICYWSCLRSPDETHYHTGKVPRWSFKGLFQHFIRQAVTATTNH